MSKRIIAIVLVLALLMSNVPFVYAESGTPDGTLENPYEIGNVTQFLQFLEKGQNSSGTTVYYSLTEDIVAAEETVLSGYTASGIVLEGNGHTVSGFSVKNAIFTEISASTIRNVTFCDITAQAASAQVSAAVLALSADADTVISGCTFDHCTVTGMTGSKEMCAVAVCDSTATIVNCTVTERCTIQGEAGTVGGIVAVNGSCSLINNCVSKVTLSAAAQTAGTVVGKNEGVLQRCYARTAADGALYGKTTGRNDAVYNCLTCVSGVYMMQGGDGQNYALMDIRQLAAEMSEGTMNENNMPTADDSALYACPWTIEDGDLALSLDGLTAQIYLYADSTLSSAEFTFTDREAYEIPVDLGQKFSVRVGDYEAGIYHSNRFTVTYTNSDRYTVVNNFVYRPNPKYVKNLINLVDGAGEATYSDVYISAEYDENTGRSSGSSVIYPYCATLSLTNQKENDELIEYQFPGSGTAEDPYQIGSVYALQCLAHYVNSGLSSEDLRYNEAHYIMTADLDVTGVQLEPIGSYSADHSLAFRGTFDGQGYRITGISFTAPTTYCGLFGVVVGVSSDEGIRNAVIKNLNLLDLSISSSPGNPGNLMGGIAGMAAYASMDGCVVQGEINGGTQLGGIVGYAYRCQIDNCGVNAVITTNYPYAWAGGIVGNSGRSTIRNCYSATAFETNEVILDEYLHIGSIAGYVTKTDFSNCFYLDQNAINCGKNTAGITLAQEQTLKSEQFLASLRDYSDFQGFASSWESGSKLACNDGYPVIQLTAERTYSVTCVVTSAGSIAANQLRCLPGTAVTVTTTVSGLQGLTVTDAAGELLDVDAIRVGRYTFSFTMPDQAVWVIPDFGTTALRGSGTEEDPYLISSREELRYMALLINEGTDCAEGCTAFGSAFYRMTEDIDLGGSHPGAISSFSGHFDGDGHTITNMDCSGENTALFTELQDAVICNLAFDNIAVESDSSAIIAALTGGSTVLSNIMVQNSRIKGTGCGGMVLTNEGQLVIANCIFKDLEFTDPSGGCVVYWHSSGGVSLSNTVFANTGAVSSTVAKNEAGNVTAWNNFYCGTACTDLVSYGTAADTTQLSDKDFIAGLSSYAEASLAELGACLWTAGDDSQACLCFGNEGALCAITYDSVFTTSSIELFDTANMVTVGVAGDMVELPYFMNVSTANLKIYSGDGTELRFSVDVQNDGLGIIRFTMPAGAVHITNGGQPLRILYLEGKGTAAAPFEIDTPEDLVLMANVINGTVVQYISGDDYVDYSKANFVLKADLDMKGVDWDGIGSGGYAFAGTFDGSGHTITNLNADSDRGELAGLFFTLSEGAAVMDLRVSGAEIYGPTAGVIAAVNNGTISRCMVTGSNVSLTSVNDFGGIAGYNGPKGLIMDCAVADSSFTWQGSGSQAIGGITQRNDGTVRNCFTYDCTFSKGESTSGAILASGNAPVHCCYYTASAVSGTFGTALDTDTFSSGKAAYWLNDRSCEEGVVWGQTIGQDTYPVLGGAIVYCVGPCPNEAYSNTNSGSFHDYQNGICSRCGTYQPASDSDRDGVYEISNAGQLYWFAAVVNSGYGDTERDTSAKAVLLNDIDLESRTWVPIGSSVGPYTGTFDGQGYAVSGLYTSDTAAEYVGLFGYVGENGTVQKVGVKDSCLCGKNEVGGIAGYNAGTVAQCYHDGTAQGENLYTGGVVGTNSGTVIQCYNVGSVSGDSHVGGVVGCNAFGGTVSFCHNVGTVSSRTCYGGSIVGLNEGMAQNCYYLTGSAIITSSQTVQNGIGASTANDTTADVDGVSAGMSQSQFASGEVTCLLNSLGDPVWGQALENVSKAQEYPVLNGPAVYFVCKDDPGYTNTNMASVHLYENGFCTRCGAIQPAACNSDGIYEISNAGQFFWFAGLVNGGEVSASAVLTEDIDLESRGWTAIGSSANIFDGTFDGAGKTVSNFALTANQGNQGLFGCVSGGTVKNFTIKGKINVTADVGNIGVIGYIPATSAVSGIHSYVDITCGGEVAASSLGGIVGAIDKDGNATVVEGCAYYGTIQGGNSYNNLAGIVGYSWPTGSSIINCGFYGTVTTNYAGTDAPQMGGIIGYVRSGAFKMHSCLSMGTLNAANAADTSGVAAFGNIRQNSSANITNNYYLEGQAAVASKWSDYHGGTTTSVTEAQLASGEVAYLLNGTGDPVWGQDLDNEVYPVPGGPAVYRTGPCTGIFYSNTYSASVHSYVNGFCSYCDGYEPAVCSDGVYEISNAGQLYWFAALVNGGEASASAVLTAQIDAENRNWLIIGSEAVPYTGSFDGQGYAVSGLYTSDTAAEYVGLFGYIGENGTVQKVQVKDSYLCGKNDVGGIAGYNAGTVTQCCHEGTVKGEAFYTGGIVGTNSGTVMQCYNTGSVSGYAYAGGLVGRNVSGGTVSNCHNVGIVSSQIYYGGSIAGMNEGTAQNCYYLTGSAIITSSQTAQNGIGASTANDTAADVDGVTAGMSQSQFASGEVAWLLNSLGDPVWGQDLDNADRGQEYPVLGGAAVYLQGPCTQITYSNTERASVHSFENGFCVYCDAYEPAVYLGGAYRIANAGQLYWFAELVNSGETSACGILTADIDLENREWTAIGSSAKAYTGTFDGAGKTISHFALTASEDDQGLFGCVSGGTVKNFTIKGKINVTADAGNIGVIGYIPATSAVSGIHSYVDITCGGEVAASSLGGIVGAIDKDGNATVVEGCAYYGTIQGGNSYNNLAGIVGYSWPTGSSIMNCGFYGIVTTSYAGTDAPQMGGIIGYVRSDAFTMRSCLSVGEVSAPNAGSTAAISAFGNIRQGTADHITNNYYLEGQTAVADYWGDRNGITAAAVTEAQLASGEVAYLLNGLGDPVWGQNLDNLEINPGYPILGGAPVYRVGYCHAYTYSNTDSENTHTYQNGFCKYCGAYEPAVLCDDVYEISNAGQLYWFAALVNGGKTSADAILTADIVVNAGVLDSEGNLTPDAAGLRAWIVIGSKDIVYTGTFNGKGHTVSGLYVSRSFADLGLTEEELEQLSEDELYEYIYQYSYVGLFAYVGYAGTVMNVGVVDSYLYSNCAYVGGVAGYNNGSVLNCYSDCTVGVPLVNAGGVVGYNGGTVLNCYHTGTVSGKMIFGGVVGRNKGTVQACYNAGTVSGSGALEAGGVIGYNNGTVRNCYNTGTVSGQSGIGGVIGMSEDGSIVDCYNTGTVSGKSITAGVAGGTDNDTVERCANMGAVSGSNIITGGVVGSCMYSVITNCYNTGTVSGGSNSVGGITGDNHHDQISNCYNTGKISSVSHNVGAISGNDEWAAFQNCYYLIGSAVDGSGTVQNGLGIYGMGKTNPDEADMTVSLDTETFDSGEAAYLLNGSTSAGSLAWGQDLDNGKPVQVLPNFDGAAVYQVETCKGIGYSNTANNGYHACKNGFCTACGAYEPAVRNRDGVYEISNGGQLYWFAELVNGGEASAKALLMKNIDAENREWTPVGDSADPYTGLFDGQGYAISGLKISENTADYAGLFGYVGSGGKVQATGVAASDISGSQYVGGIVGYNAGTIERCFSTAVLWGKNAYAGGVAGYNSDSAVIVACYHAGTLRGNTYVGGIVGFNSTYGTVEGCHNVGTVSSQASYGGGVAGKNGGTIQGCYYLTGSAVITSSQVKQNGIGASDVNMTTADLSGVTAGMSAAQFASGEVAYLLNGSASQGERVWGQNLDNDEPAQTYPVLGGAAVYRVGECTDSTYSNTDSGGVHTYENGFCTNCDAYQPAVYSNGAYRISNAGQLYWFAELVNGGETSANGVLTKNIQVNGSDASEYRDWLIIGSENVPYTGIFEGQGWTISGLCFENSERAAVGLFGQIGEDGMVRNVGIVDSSFSGYDDTGSIAGCSYGRVSGCFSDGAVNGAYHTGGIVGRNEGTVENCYSLGSVSGAYCVGGVAGRNKGTILNSYSMAAVSGETYRVGGIAGWNEGTAENCCYLPGCAKDGADAEQYGTGASSKGSAEADTEGVTAGKTSDLFASGEVAYLLNGSTAAGTLAWGQNLDNGSTVQRYPVLGGAAVYQVTVCEKTAYSNTNSSRDHQYENGVCTLCGKVCTHNWNNGVCTVCAMVCSHNWEDGICTVCGAEKTPTAPTVNVVFPTLSFEDEIFYYITFSVENPDNVLIEEMGLLTWSSAIDGTVETAEAIVPGTVTYGSYLMARSEGVPAKNMADTLYFKVYLKLVDGSYVYSELKSYSAKDYAFNQLSDGNTSPQLKALCVALLNYGAAAQTYFGYHTEALLNGDLTDEQKALVDAYSNDMLADMVNADASKTAALAANGGFSRKYPAIDFGGAFSISYNFVPSAPVDGEMKLYVWDAETYAAVDALTLDNASEVITMEADTNGIYTGSVTGIAAKDIDATVYVCGVYESNGITYCTGVLSYSLGAYCKSLAVGTSAMQPFAAATAVYAYYAKVYLSSI